MTTLLAHHLRRAAHGKHRCQLCGERIEYAEMYLDQRLADEGTVYTFRAHTRCDARYWAAHHALELFSDESLEWSEVLAWEAETP